ncbi:MAG: HD-GYP domain-containing protein [Gemmatimonadaceae bacterium]
MAAITFAALGSWAALFALYHDRPAGWLVAIACMAGWGLIAQILSHRIGGDSLGSIASIPYLAGAFLVPNWELLAAILVAELVVGMVHRRPAIKATFNVAQTTLGFALAILVYRLLGGVPLLGGGAFHPVAFVAGVVVAFATNTVVVSGVLAITTSRNFSSVWRASTRGSLFYDVLAAPLPYLFAQLFIAKGVVGALMLAVPLLVVRQIFVTAWKLEQATQDLLQLMVKAIEARDPYTSGHSHRVQEYAMIIGRATGMSTRAIERLGKAALLHDVGKIHEMYAPILRKPDKLTAEEWTIMKTHPVKSAELVAAVSHLRDIVPAVRHHHENWDGSGYPDAVSGKVIPVFSRIIAIADTIDAMTTTRPYRSARSLETVRAELASMSGRQFDPEICQVLLQGAFFAKLSDAVSANIAAADDKPETPTLRFA